MIYRPLCYERVYPPLHKVADTPFHIHCIRLLGGGPGVTVETTSSSAAVILRFKRN